MVLPVPVLLPTLNIILHAAIYWLLFVVPLVRVAAACAARPDPEGDVENIGCMDKVRDRIGLIRWLRAARPLGTELAQAVLTTN
jgi:hypothetical protein